MATRRKRESKMSFLVEGESGAGGLNQAPAIVVEERSLSALRPYGRNPKIHSAEQVEQIARSIERFGWTNPVLVDEADEVIAGHGRVAAAQRLGRDKVPVIVVSGLTDAAKRALRIADNRIAENAGWDAELLRDELRALHEADFDLDIVGFSADDLDEIFDDNFLTGGGRAADPKTSGSLAEKFGVPPFSVLNAREGWWQARKRAWIALGIQSELGRGENLIGRSLHERLSLVFADYRDAKAFIEKHRAAGKTDAEIEALAAAHG